MFKYLRTILYKIRYRALRTDVFEPRPDFAKELRAKLVPAPSSAPRRYFRQYAAGFAVLLLASNGGAMVFANAADVGISHPLYEYKRLGESVELTFANLQGKAALSQTFAVRRLHELESIELIETESEDITIAAAPVALMAVQENTSTDAGASLAAKSAPIERSVPSVKRAPVQAQEEKKAERVEEAKKILRENIRAQKERLDKDLRKAIDVSIDRAENVKGTSTVLRACNNALTIIKSKRRLNPENHDQWEKFKERCGLLIDTNDESERGSED